MRLPPFRSVTIALAAAAALAATPASPARAEDGAIAQINQVGGGANTATIEQKFVASGGLGDTRNRVDVWQDGTGNEADIIQQGDALTATVTQSNIGNHAVVEQYGSMHAATVTQNGGRSVEIVQSNIYTEAHGAPTGGPGQTIIVDQTH